MNCPKRFVWIFLILSAWTWGLLVASEACTPTPPKGEAALDGGGSHGEIHTSNESIPDVQRPKESPKEAPSTIQIRASGPDKALDPGKPGPYQVGVTTLRLTDPDRIDPQTKQPRPMVIEVWYPAVDAAKDSPTDVYDVSKDAPTAVQQKIKSLGITPPTMAQNAHRDAKPLTAEGPYPVVLFSHGSGGIRYQSIFQTVHLASHGYVVISPDHAGNTLYDLFLDPNAQQTANLLKAAANRPIDMMFSMNAVKKRVETQGDLLYGLAKFDQVAITGHSFGGLTSILVTRTFKNLAVIVPQAPATTLIKALGVRPEHLKKMPMMLLASQADQTLDYAKEQKGFYDLLLTEPYFGAERHMITFVKGGHFTFSNICDLDLTKYAKKLGFGNASKILNDGCAAHNTPIKEAHRLINHYTTAIFNVFLRGSEVSRQYLKQLPTQEITYVHKEPKE